MSTNTAAMYALLERARQKNAANKLYRLDMFDPVSAPAGTTIPTAIAAYGGGNPGVPGRETSVAPEGFAADVASRFGKSVIGGSLTNVALGGDGIPSGFGLAKTAMGSLIGASNLAESITGKKSLGWLGQAIATMAKLGIGTVVKSTPLTLGIGILADLGMRAAFGEDANNGLAKGTGYSDIGGVQSNLDSISNNVFGDFGDPFASSMYGNPKSYMDTLADSLFGENNAPDTSSGLQGYGDYGTSESPDGGVDMGSALDGATPEGPDTSLQSSNNDNGLSASGVSSTHNGGYGADGVDSLGNTASDRSSGVGHGGFGDRGGSGFGGSGGLGGPGGTGGTCG